MTVSNSTDFNQTRDQIITNALVNLGVYRPGGTVNSNDLTFCSNWLNMIVKAWEAIGVHMWSLNEGTLFLRNGVNQYSIYSTSTDQAGDNCIETTLTAAASGTSLTVSSTTGMTANDNIGIQLDNNTRQWTTIISVTSSTTLTILTGVTSTASSGNSVITYTTASPKPIHISSVRFRNSDGTDRPCVIKGRDDFMLIPNKTITGKVNTIHYSPNLTSTTMYVWPTPDSCADRIRYSYIRMLDDFDSGSDTPDFPSEWLLPLTLTLMWRVARAYGKGKKDLQELEQDAMRSLNEMQMFDSDDGSTMIVPDDNSDN